MTILYLDYEHGNDAADGSTFALGGLPAVGPLKTITGCTEAKLGSSGERIVHMAKSPPPVLVGNATWTHLSANVILESAQTKNINMCETAWTKSATGDVTASSATSNSQKEGNYCALFQFDASVLPNRLQAYQTITPTSFAEYQCISFWLSASNMAEGALNLCLCSDDYGVTIVDSVVLPYSPYGMACFVLPRTGGGSLGASIRSIAIYTGSDAAKAATLNNRFVYIDDIIATKSNGLDLTTLISKNSLEQGGSEGWYGIQSINGLTIRLDAGSYSSPTTGRGYYTAGASPETVPTYLRRPIRTLLANSSSVNIQEVMLSGSSGNLIQFLGGYNTATNLQDGDTLFDGGSCNGCGISASSKNYFKLDHISVFRYLIGISFSNCFYSQIGILHTLGNCGSSGFWASTGYRNTVDTIENLINNGYGLNFTSRNSTINRIGNILNNLGTVFISNNVFIKTIDCMANNAGGVSFQGPAEIGEITLADYNNGVAVFMGTNVGCLIGKINTTNHASYYSIGASTGFGNKIDLHTYTEALPFGGATQYAFPQILVENDNGTGNQRLHTEASYFIIPSGVNQFQGFVTGTYLDALSPTQLILATIYCRADRKVGVSAIFQKSHASDIAADLFCRGDQVAGVLETAVLKADDTNEETLSMVFTPTENGSVIIRGRLWWVANLADENVIIKNIFTSSRTYGKTFFGDTATVDFNYILKYDTETDNPYITEFNQATVAGYSSKFTWDASGLLVSSDGTVFELYDYTQLKACEDVNMSKPVPFVTADKATFYVYEDLTIDGCTLSGGTAIIEMGDHVFISLNGGKYDGIISYGTTRLVHIKLDGLVAGTTVQIYDVTAEAELYKGIAAGTSLDLVFTWTEDHTIRGRWRKAGYKPGEYTGTVTNSGFAVNVTQEVDAVYLANGIDGSTVTEFSLQEGVIGIFGDDPDNVTTGQRLYNWYMYAIATPDFIDDQANLVTAETSWSYILSDTLKLQNLDLVNPLFMSGANINNISGNGQVVDTSGGTMVINGYFPFNSASDVGAAVWNASLGDAPAGSYGELVEAIEGGRWKIDPSTRQMIFFKSDNLTEVMRFKLFNAEGVPSVASVFERTRV